MWGYKINNSFFRSILRIGRTKTALNLIAVDVDDGETLQAAVNSNNSFLAKPDNRFVRNLFQDYDQTLDNTEAIRISRAALAASLFENGEVVYWKPDSESFFETTETDYSVNTEQASGTAIVREVEVYVGGREIPATGSVADDGINITYSYSVNGTSIDITLSRSPGVVGSPVSVKIKWHLKIIEVES